MAVFKYPTIKMKTLKSVEYLTWCYQRNSVENNKTANELVHFWNYF